MIPTLLLILLLSSPQPQRYALSSYFRSPENVRQVNLANKLREISGLALGPDGRLFAHDDETAVIYQLAHHSGEIIKKFEVGDKKAESGDFEGLAVAGTDFYLITSRGDIYLFREGRDEEVVPYHKYKTWLNSDHDVEGLCHDPETNALLVACKGDPGDGYEGSKAVFSFSLSGMELEKEPRFLLNIEEIVADEKDDFIEVLGDFFLLTSVKTFAPSGLERHPVTGNFFILSALGNRIIEVSPAGTLLNKEKLDFDRHQQPEGISFLADLTLVIGDEGMDRRATLTAYPAGVEQPNN